MKQPSSRLGAELRRVLRPHMLLILLLWCAPAWGGDAPQTGGAATGSTPVAAPAPTAEEQQAKVPKPARGSDEALAYDKLPESLEDLKSIQEQVEKVVQKVMPCTLSVTVGGAQGSAVIVSKDGYVLTAGHVCGKPGRSVLFRMQDGRRLRGVTLGRNIGIDSGLMKITDEGEWPCVELGISAELKSGQWCICTGHPGGFQPGRAPVVRLGRIVEASSNVIRTDCTLVGGDSGGPLFDMHGRVIGIHSRISGPLTANFHVPVDTYYDTWDRLAASEEWGGRPTGPIIGIRGEDAEDGEGCRIIELFPGLPAAEGGVEVGDVVTRLDDKPVRSLKDLVDLIAKRKVGEEVTLKLIRDGETITKKLKLASRQR